MLTLNTELQYKKVNTNLYTACGLKSFYRPGVLCDRAFVCHVDDDALLYCCVAIDGGREESAQTFSTSGSSYFHVPLIC